MQECNQRNENGDRHGYWESYHPNGQLRYSGNYINGKKDGYWEQYWSYGNLWYKGNFINGEQVGYWFKFDKEYYYARM